MNRSHHIDPSTISNRFGANVRLYLLESLVGTNHRQRAGNTRRRKPVTGCDHIPADVVVGGSQVTYSIDGGPAQTGLLAHRAMMGVSIGVIPASSPLGTTLNGMRIGQRAPLKCADGTIATVLVLATSRPA